MKAFIIHLPEREHSLTYAQKMHQQLLEFGLDAHLHVGTNATQAMEYVAKDHRTLYPFSIKNQELSANEMQDFIRPELWDMFQFEHVWKVHRRLRVGADAGKMSRPGVIGCFYSHYSLWQKCMELGEPIMIFEDDVKFYRGWTPVDWEGVLILSLGKSSFLNEPYRTYLENPRGTPQPMPWRQFSMPGASGYAIKPDAAQGLCKAYRNYFYPADNAINKSITTLQIHNYIMGRNTLPEEGNISMTRVKGQ
jgi:GR25 family glycosyltransferase involved in LPS biosynthesis